MTVEVAVLGGVEVRRDGETVAIPRGFAPQVIAALVIDAPRVVADDVLVERVWGQDAASRLASLRNTVLRLRSLLGADVIVRRGDGYLLDSSRCTLDSEQFVRLLDIARAAESAEDSAEAYAQALALVRGRPFADVAAEPWAMGAVREWEELIAVTEEELIDRWLVSDPNRRLGQIHRAAVERPHREYRWFQVMTAYAVSGRRTEALRAGVEARAALAEFGMVVGRDLVELERRIFREDVHPPAGAAAHLVLTAEAVPAPGLLGREREIRHAQDLLSRHRALKIVGLGGIGKSTLAQAIGAAVGDPVVFVPLASVRDPSLIGVTVTSALGRRADVSTEAALADALDTIGAARVTIVLDNCEHLAGDATLTASRVLAACPNARVLMTSRVPLALAGAVEMKPPPLAVGTRDEPGPAALLLADRAGLDADALHERWDEVIALCGRAGGVPLAIELLAKGWMRPPAGGTAADDPLTAVADAARAVVGQLPRAATGALRRVSLLPDGFGVGFGATVLGLAPDEMAYHVAGAEQRGLLVPVATADEIRFRALEPVREVLIGGLDVEELHAERERMCAALTAFADSALPSYLHPVDEQAMVVLERERMNVLDAFDDHHGLDPRRLLSLAVALAPVWRETAQVKVGTDLLDRFASLIDEVDGPTQARYLLCRVIVTPTLADRATHRSDLMRARDLAQRHSLLDLEMRCIAELCVGHGWAGDREAAHAYLAELTSMTPPDAPEFFRANIDLLKAMGRGSDGDVRGAADDLTATAGWLEANGFTSSARGALFMAATFLRIAGLHDLAFSTLQRAQALTGLFGGFNRTQIAYELAKVAQSRGDASAGQLLSDALAQLEQFGEQRGTAICRRDLGLWMIGHGERDAGVEHLRRSIRPLLRHDRRAAGVALAALAVTVGSGSPVAARLMSTAAVALAASTHGVGLSAAEREMVERAAHLSSPEYGVVADENLLALVEGDGLSR